MKTLLFLLFCSWASLATAQTTAKEWFDSGVRSLFDKDKVAYQNECFTKAIQLDPKFMDAYHYRGSNHYRQEKYKEALSDYNHYIDLAKKEAKPSSFVLAKIYYQRGECHIKMHKKKEALHDYELAHKTFPKEEKYQTAYDNLKKELGGK